MVYAPRSSNIHNPCNIMRSISIDLVLQNAIGQEEEEEEANTIADVNFSSPLDNTFQIGTLFLVEYENTTSLKPIGKVGLGNFELTFAGYGIINGTIQYNDNGTGIYMTNLDDGSVYQKGIIEVRTKSGNDSIKTTYESISSSSDSQNGDKNIVIDNGVMFFNKSSSSSSSGEELSFLSNKVAIYKDIIDLSRGNLTTIAWEWK
jgi:hypothetical protein